MPRLWFRLACLLAVTGASACRREPTPAPAPSAAAAALPAPVIASAAADGKLTRELIMNGPEEQVQEAIVERVLAVIGDDWNAEVAIVRSLPPGARMVYTSRMLQAEVWNGGFNQYFWNSSGRLAEEALAGYQLIGAKQHAALLEQAIEQRRLEEPLMKRLRETGTQQAFSESYKHTKLGSLDRRFRGLAENADRLRMEYIRSHPDEFLGSALERRAP